MRFVVDHNSIFTSGRLSTLKTMPNEITDPVGRHQGVCMLVCSSHECGIWGLFNIAEMIGLLGSPPPEVIQRYQYMREYSWPKTVRREDGRVYETAEEYFCGLFFDEKGCFLYEDLISDYKLGDKASFLAGEEKEAFLDIAKGMLVWHPDARKNAAELAGHPVLQPKQTSS